MPSPEFQWFWELIDQSDGPDACWPWLGERVANGYGCTYIKSRRVLAHRMALMLSMGEPPDGKPQALHSCDNRPCCNPAHLRWGTPADNIADCVERGRAVHPQRWKMDRKELVDLRDAGWSYNMIAERFGVNHTSVAKALKRLGYSGAVSVNGNGTKELRERTDVHACRSKETADADT